MSSRHHCHGISILHSAVVAFLSCSQVVCGSIAAANIETSENYDNVMLLQVALDLHTSAHSVIVPPNASKESITLESPTVQPDHLLPLAWDLFPMAWVHVPKCGSTFFNSLWKLPGACDLNLLNISRWTDMAILKEGCKRSCFNTTEICAGSFFAGACANGLTGHDGIGSVYESDVKGHGVLMLRQPEQRIISGYYDHFHSWPEDYYGRPPLNMKEYAQGVSGCAVKMFTRDSPRPCDLMFPCGSPIPATAKEAEIAVERLRSGFKFVGILEDWNLSICLFHLMFGGNCYESEFQNINEGVESSAEPYDTSELEGFKDHYDGLLYEEAQRIFRENVKKFGASAATCEPCFRQAGLK